MNVLRTINIHISLFYGYVSPTDYFSTPGSHYFFYEHKDKLHRTVYNGLIKIIFPRDYQF